MDSQVATALADSRLDDTADNTGLLAALSPQALSLLQPHLRRLEFEKGALLWDANEAVGQIYFPHSGLISIMLPGTGGHCIEVGSIGPEGAAGLHELSVRAGAPTRAIVRVGGIFSVIPARQFHAAAQQCDEIAALAALGCDWLLQQAQQMAACNATHSADARFARWLLLASTRTGSDMIPMIQEELAALFVIRRTTASLIAQGLHNAGAIDYARGKIRIRDHSKLEAAACPCCAALGRRHWPSTRLAAPAARAPAAISSAR